MDREMGVASAAAVAAVTTIAGAMFEMLAGEVLMLLWYELVVMVVFLGVVVVRWKRGRSRQRHCGCLSAL